MRTGKSVGAVFIVQIDPERAKQMREMQANLREDMADGQGHRRSTRSR